MSAYLTSQETRSIIAKSIYHYTKRDTFLNYSLEKYHNKSGMNWLNPKDKDFEKRFFWLLTNVNMVSLGQKYEDVKDWEKEADKNKYDKKAPVLKIPALLALIGNWSYQSCEGLANESDFYKLIQELKSKLASYFIEKYHPVDYWGIDDYEKIKDSDLEIPRGAILMSDMMREI